MDKIFDFDNFEPSLRRYGGSNKKKSVRNEKAFYILKFSDSYDIFSEYIACHIIRSLGIKSQKTIIGTFGGKIAVGCKDFCTGGFYLNEFFKYAVGYGCKSNVSDIGIILKILSDNKTFPHPDTKERFWDMFVVDALLGNPSRDSKAWGFVYNEETSVLRMAPIYSCRSCLYPLVPDAEIADILNSQEKINEMVYRGPVSAFDADGDKISYYDFLMSTEEIECLNAIMRIGSRIDMDAISSIVDNTPLISDLRKNFYKTMITARKEKIILPAYVRANMIIKDMGKNEGILFKKPDKDS